MDAGSTGRGIVHGVDSLTFTENDVRHFLAAAAARKCPVARISIAPVHAATSTVGEVDSRYRPHRDCRTEGVFDSGNRSDSVWHYGHRAMPPDSLFETNLDVIDRSINRVCHDARIAGADADDFASSVKAGAARKRRARFCANTKAARRSRPASRS
jgi:hypothetical protein